LIYSATTIIELLIHIQKRQKERGSMENNVISRRTMIRWLTLASAAGGLRPLAGRATETNAQPKSGG
jgi:hypothetical protein